MNYQIIYLAIYRVLECLEEEKPNEELSNYLDIANPYVFKDRKSADPIFYNEFEKWIADNDIKITEDNSFDIASKYVSEKTNFIHIFTEIDQEEWQTLINIIKEEEPQLANRK